MLSVALGQSGRIYLADVNLNLIGYFTLLAEMIIFFIGVVDVPLTFALE